MNGMNCLDEALRLLDHAMALLEQVERGVGSVAEQRETGVSRGTVYGLYTNLVRLHDKLVELRRVLASCGGDRGAGEARGPG